MPIPIYYGHGGGGDPKFLVALFLALNISLLVWLVVRYLLVKKKVNFLKDLFYDEYNLDLNMPTMFLLLITVLELLGSLTFYILTFL